MYIITYQYFFLFKKMYILNIFRQHFLTHVFKITITFNRFCIMILLCADRHGRILYLEKYCEFLTPKYKLNLIFNRKNKYFYFSKRWWQAPKKIIINNRHNCKTIIHSWKPKVDYLPTVFSVNHLRLKIDQHK